MKALSRMTAAIAPSISLLMVWYCSCRSAKGTGIASSFLLVRQPARRIAGIRPRRRNVPGHDRTRADHDIVGDPDRHDRGVGADRNTVADHGLAPQLPVAAGRTTGRERIVHEHHAMADKAILADGYQFADEGVRLHPRAGTDHDAFLYFGERPDKAVVAYLAAIKIARLDDLDARAEIDVAHAGLMHLGPVHDTTPRRPSRGAKRSGTSAPVSIDS